ncbi:MAG: phosphatase PAP2 family protein [Phycisphaeraceae bacterium]|nr:phosphatase PAP2 family protein [Phycisphaeraceae bacterium]
MAIDYNRGLAWPVRAGHVIVAGLMDWIGPLWTWAVAPVRRRWTIPLLLALPVFWLVHPFDALIDQAARSLAARSFFRGDIVREWSAWQQFGAAGSLLFTAAAVWLADRARARRLLDLLAASLVGLAAFSALKLGIGRPRPKFGDAETILWPWGAYPLGPGRGVKHAWESGAGAELWSMPSSHTVFAVILAWFLARMYPRLAPLCIAAAAIVGLGRIVFSAHWASDVAVGALVGVAVARATIDGWWGVRGLDWLWRRVVNRQAEPAYPMLAARFCERAIGRHPIPSSSDGLANVPSEAAATGGADRSIPPGKTSDRGVDLRP